MSKLESRKGEAEEAFRKALENKGPDKEHAGGRGDNTQHAGKADGPGHAKGDEWAAAREAANKQASFEKGAKIHDNATNKGPDKDNKGPSL